MTRRVAVTGIGCVSAIGNTAPEFWASCLAGQCGIAQIRGFDMTGVRFQNGAQARDYEAGKKKAEACKVCHGADGNTPVTPDTPRLAGQY